MKKKILSFVLAMLLIIPCAFLMTACGGNIKTGVEYRIEKVEFVWESEEAKNRLLDGRTEQDAKDYYDQINAYIIFKDDGSAVSVFNENTDPEIEDEENVIYYEVKNGMVYIYQTPEKEGETDVAFKIENEMLVQEQSIGSAEEKSIVKIYYKAS